jgi:uncharacterized damage-inducible protein DinB
MREIDRILDQRHRAYSGDAWYGSSVRDALFGVDAPQAAMRPIAEAHTIWEIVLHLTSWTREITRRLQQGNAQDPVDGDWPPMPVPADEPAWNTSLNALEAAHAALVAAMKQVDERRYDDVIGDERVRETGGGVSYYVTLHGIIQHDIYHAGQIALLRKGVSASGSGS